MVLVACKRLNYLFITISFEINSNKSEHKFKQITKKIQHKICCNIYVINLCFSKFMKNYSFFWVKLNEKRVKTSNISKVIKKLKFEEKFSIVAHQKTEIF